MNKFEILTASAIIPIALGLYQIPKYFQPQPIIYININDISQSARDYKSPNGQTYDSLMKENCQASLDKLNTGDIYISGKFTTEVISETHQINYQEKSRLIDLCSHNTEPELRISKRPGTSLGVAIDRLEREINHQRSQNIKYPIVATIAIDANEPEPGKPSEDVKAIAKRVKTLTAKEQIQILFVGSSVGLQKQLKEPLGNNPMVEIAALDRIATLTSDGIESARKSSPVK